jgi:hypothetical protein
MKLGIVGSEAAKFTPESEQLARGVIQILIKNNEADIVISGACHLGGIDKWAVEEAIKCGIKYIEYPPKQLSWEGGYKQRNLQIARNSDYVVCITVKQLPKDYTGMKFSYCYHCMTDDHVKSGGCWTVKQAKLLGKKTAVIVVDQYHEKTNTSF